MKRSQFSVLVVSLCLLLGLAVPVFACTSIPVSKSASADGSVMTAHTCDGWYDARTWVVPAADHKAGAMEPIYRGLLHSDRSPAVKIGEVPFPAHTYKWFYAGYPYMNENGVIMGETTINNRKELSTTEGGIFFIEELQILALEQAKTAKEACQIMGDYAEKYGYIDAGECLTVGDQNEVWFFECMPPGPMKTGAVWAAVRIPEGNIGVSANRSRIDVLDPKDPNQLIGKMVYPTATANGWWDPNGSDPLVFWKAFGSSDSMGSRRREWRVLSTFAPSLKLDANASRFPFSVKAEKPVTIQDMMKLYRDTYEGTTYDKANNPALFMRNSKGEFVKAPWATPHASSDFLLWMDIPNERNISIPGCSYHTILQSRGGMNPGLGTLTWFGLNNPDTSTYIPIYAGITSLPANYAVNDRSKFSFDNRLASAWWCYDYVDNLVNQRYQDEIKDLRAVRDPLEAEQFALQPAIEKVASELYAKDPVQAAAFLTNYTASRAKKALDTFWSLAETLIAKYDDKTF